MKCAILAFLVLLVSCGSDKNDLMTKLINEKKAVEDSLRISSALEMDFQSKARANKADSNISFALIDSSTFYQWEGRRFRIRLDKIEFSIDSLSKMK